MRTIELQLVTSAKFPERLDEKEFAVPLPKGTTCVFFESGMSNALSTERLKESVADAMERFPDLIRRAQARQRKGNDRD